MTRPWAGVALSFLFFLGAEITTAAAIPITKTVTLTVNEAFLPAGFNAITNAYVVVSGLFPNSCYSWAKADVIHINTFLHEVRSSANVSQTMCLMVMIPYQKQVDLGKLASGDHTLRFVNGDGTYFERDLRVE